LYSRRGIFDSPAHAEIDQPPPPSSSTPLGLPRPRGDRPLVEPGVETIGASPPPTPGSTRD